MTFIERTHENEKNRALSYVANLLDEAKNSKEECTEDIMVLEEIQRLLSAKKYGLVWESHLEIVEEEMKSKIPIFQEEYTFKISDDYENTDYNFLLEGDNLHSLHLLEKTHKGEIDTIYIDPPYNTGAKNWKYNNSFVDNKDTFKHSKWLSFMNARLLIAKELLKPTGIIVLTIDDYELENILMLMNEIFGEDNRLGTVIIKNNPQGRSSVTGFQVSHEYALFYGKQMAKIGRIKRNTTQKSRYKERDSYGAFEWRNFRAQYSTESPKMVYPIFVKKDLSDFRIPNLEWSEQEKKYTLLEKPKTK